jgi:hypothetical protein
VLQVLELMATSQSNRDMANVPVVPEQTARPAQEHAAQLQQPRRTQAVVEAITIAAC